MARLHGCFSKTVKQGPADHQPPLYVYLFPLQLQLFDAFLIHYLSVADNKNQKESMSHSRLYSFQSFLKVTICEIVKDPYT